MPGSPHTAADNTGGPPTSLLIRELRTAAGVTLAMTTFSSVVYREPFVNTLIYTLCIAPLIQALIEGGRFGFAALLRRRFPDAARSLRAWPGWGVMVPWVVVSGIVGYVVGHELGDLLTGHHGTPTMFLRDSRAVMLAALAVVVPALGITFFFEAHGRMADMEARTQAAMRAAAENQLKLLEAQLEPHMLFNTLANLRVLIGTDPPRAQHMLDRLIDFLRSTLEASRQAVHPLETEFARLTDYLELMQVRMGPRLQYRLDLPPALAALPVPPLLLQPLVENAIRHGLEPKIGGGRLEVSAAREDAMLMLRVRDTGVGLADPLSMGASMSTGVPSGLFQDRSVSGPGSAHSSFGTQQVRDRLATLYGDAGALELVSAADSEGGTLAVVRLPIG